MADLLARWLDAFAGLFPATFWLHDSFNVRALLAITLVSIICGAAGTLVVGNRMAFFSDALAHCAFAGIALGLLISLWMPKSESAIVPVVMLGFGLAVGVLIAYVRERTGLESDTVIGVFFAGAVGFGGMLFATLSSRTQFRNPESFLFGGLLFVTEAEIIALAVLAAVVALALVVGYNGFALASFNRSLARSRQVPLRLLHYAFVVLLALVVNLYLNAVGALLINALLVVPAATAALMARNLRQLFWLSVIGSWLCGVAGLWISNTVRIPIGGDRPLEFAPGGTIICLAVGLFFLVVMVRPLVRRSH